MCSFPLPVKGLKGRETLEGGSIDRISSWRKMCIGAEESYLHSRYMKEKTLCKADGGQAGVDTQDPGSRNTSLFSGAVYFFKSLKSLALVGLKKYRMVDRPTAVV